jgi:RHS repeat-associated protein
MSAGPQPRYETADANTQWYKYDAWNRLVEVSQGASSPGTPVAQYRYDGLNRRIRKYVASDYVIAYCGQDVLCAPGLILRPPPSSYWNVTEYYYNESWQVLETREALEVGRSGEPLSEPGVSASTREQYVWGAQYIDAPVVRFRDGNLDGDFVDAGIDSTLYYTYDGNFNVTALVKPDGTVAERYTYDPYGQVTFKNADWSDAASQAKSAYDNEILYCGYRFDPESGNYIVRRRYLTPPLGRWLTNDLIGYRDGMNLYQYVRSNSVKLRDWTGMETASSQPGECYCGPDVTDFLRDLITHTVTWRNTQLASRAEGLVWLRANGLNLDWKSTDGNPGLKTKLCPSAVCKNTYWLCGECVHDRWIGNFMFGLLGRLFRIPDWSMNLAGDTVQSWYDREDARYGDEDPSWDSGGYDVARSAFDEITNPKGKHDICDYLKSDMNAWNQANDTGATPPPERSEAIGGNWSTGVVYRRIPSPVWPKPAAIGQKNCKKCPEELPETVRNTVPGGNFPKGFPDVR